MLGVGGGLQVRVQVLVEFFMGDEGDVLIGMNTVVLVSLLGKKISAGQSGRVAFSRSFLYFLMHLDFR